MYPNWLLLLLLSSLTGSVLTAQHVVVANTDSQKPLLATLSSAEDPGSASDQRTTTTRFSSNGHAARLNYSSPAPHLFASAYGLLQQWSNTMFPNGHTMAAVEVPPFTLLYHGRTDDAGGAPSPEWLAFDIEMAYGIMGSTRQSFMLTYQTTRPVKALYFDGESAALMGLGQLDTQMLHLYGNVSGPDAGSGGGRWRGLEPEYDRAMGLCDWLLERGLRGDGWGIEGVVRMNAGFEMIWCDFGGGSLRLVSRTNVTAPQTKEKKDGGEGGVGGTSEGREKGAMDEGIPTSVYTLPPQPTLTERPVSPSRPPLPPNWRGIMDPVEREPFLQSQGWEWFASATWHYGSNGAGAGKGETRARVLGCGITSWYSKGRWGAVADEERTRLNLTADGHWVDDADDDKIGNRSVALGELGRRRRLHHLEGVTASQAAGMRWDTEVMLRDAVVGSGRGCSGMEWAGTMGEIVQRTAGHLMALEQGARSFAGWGNTTEVREWLYGLRGQSHAFLMPFLEYPHEIGPGTWDVAGGGLFGETYSRCRYRYTRLLVDVALSARERDLRDATEEVMGGICGVLLEVGFGIERAWFELEEEPAEGGRTGLEAESQGWADAVRRLRAWVGWEGEFTRCTRVCEWDERCYIPMWPLLRSVWGRKWPRPPPERGPENGTEPGGSLPPPPYRGREPGHGGGNRTGPGYGMPGRGSGWMGDETDLWEPKCVKMEDIMPRGRG